MDEHIRRRTQKQPELVRDESVAACAVGEQIQLLFLDPVLHLAALTVHIFIQLLRIARNVGHDEPWIVTLLGVLGFDNHTATPLPRPSRIGERAEDALRLACLLELPLGTPDFIASSATKGGVFGQSENVADAVRIAPPHQSPATEPTVAPDGDFHVRPGFAKLADQEFQQRGGVLRAVDITGSEVGREEFVATEDV